MIGAVVTGCLVALPVFIIILMWVRMRRDRKNEEYILDDEPFVEAKATVDRKDIGRYTIGRAGYDTRRGYENHLSHVIWFRLDSGETLELDVPPEVYGTILEGERDTLVTLNGRFVDFGGRTAEVLPEEAD